ncbi:MAG: FtsQ-type POTRA domain-containing protein [Coriobacteriales bacterium]|jgi:cell division protein FtsQ|nr:FtsQ-type POTRA domain-containing protein [Coriobacteriales bacterium]
MKSASLALKAKNKRRLDLQKAHRHSPRQAKPHTPRVLKTAPDAKLSGTSHRRQGSYRSASVCQTAATGSRKQNGSSAKRDNKRQGDMAVARSGQISRGRGSNAQAADRENWPAAQRYSSSAGTARTARKGVRKSGVRVKLFIILMIFVLLVGGCIALYHSPLFPLSDVSVVGNNRLSSDYLVEAAAVPADSTFLRLDTAGISERLTQEPWIQNVELERVFPGGLIIKVTERQIAAVVDIVPERATEQTAHWAIASDGIWIALADNQEGQRVALSTEQLAAFTRIKDVSPAVRPVAGAKETDGGVTNALAVLAGFSQEMREMVASISAPDAVKTALTLSNNVGVAFGAAVDVAAKEDAIATLLEEHQGTITYINVRVANRATYRSAQ